MQQLRTINSKIKMESGIRFQHHKLITDYKLLKTKLRDKFSHQEKKRKYYT